MVTTIAGYEVDELLGRGAMGEVYRAHRIGSDAPVAIKVLRADVADDPDLVARFLRERDIMCSVDHQHVVKVRDLVVEGGSAAIVMEFVAGGDLRRLLRRAGTLKPFDAAILTQQVAGGLAAIHRAGIIHRDVKPENVLMGEDGDARLSDFGIARLVEGPRLTQASGILGTIDYMAPEVIRGSQATAAIDIYGAGIMLYELLGGVRPYSGGPPASVLHRHLEEDPVRLSGLPDDLWAQIVSMTAKDPASRPSAAAVAASMSALVPILVDVPALHPADVEAMTAQRSPRGSFIATSTAVNPETTDDSPTLHRLGEAPAETATIGVAMADEGWVSRRRRLGLIVGGAVLVVVTLIVALLLSAAPGHPSRRDASVGRRPPPTTPHEVVSKPRVTSTSTPPTHGSGTSVSDGHGNRNDPGGLVIPSTAALPGQSGTSPAAATNRTSTTLVTTSKTSIPGSTSTSVARTTSTTVASEPVPNVVGDSPSAAQAALASAGFSSVGSCTSGGSTPPPGIVTYQSVAPGTRLPRGSAVTFSYAIEPTAGDPKPC